MLTNPVVVDYPIPVFHAGAIETDYDVYARVDGNRCEVVATKDVVLFRPLMIANAILTQYRIRRGCHYFERKVEKCIVLERPFS